MNLYRVVEVLYPYYIGSNTFNEKVEIVTNAELSGCRCNMCNKEYNRGVVMMVEGKLFELGLWCDCYNKLLRALQDKLWLQKEAEIIEKGMMILK